MTTRTECGVATVLDGETVRCDKTATNHRHHSGWSWREHGHVDWLNDAYEPPKTQESPVAESKVRTLARRMNSRQAAAEGAEQAAQAWTPVQQLVVESAITEVAEAHGEFTTDQVWAVLGDRVPMTSGLSAMLKAAQRKGLIEATERFRCAGKEH